MRIRRAQDVTLESVEHGTAIGAESAHSSFDAAAASYDATFTARRLGRWLRDAVRAEIGPLFGDGERVLELGCGTGEDALWLARRGVHVTATDASPAMLALARRKAEEAGVGRLVEFARLDLNQILDLRFWTSDFRSKIENPKSKIFDGVFSNFGPLNCLPDRRPLAAALAAGVRPGGRVALVVMSPLCPWEIAWHLAHGEAAKALRRWRPGEEAHVGGGATVPVWYPTPLGLRREFRHHFRHVATVGIGVLLPPSYLDHLVERWPRHFEALAPLDRRLGRSFPWTWLNDHYLAVFERR